MYLTPVGVLRALASVFHCRFDRIEAAVSKAMGVEVPRHKDAEQRLSAIRKALLTPEAASVIEQAQLVKKETEEK